MLKRTVSLRRGFLNIHNIFTSLNKKNIFWLCTLILRLVLCWNYTALRTIKSEVGKIKVIRSVQQMCWPTEPRRQSQKAWSHDTNTVKPVLSGHSKRRPKLIFKTDYCLMQVKSNAECSKGSILQYFGPSLSYHLSLRSFFFLFLSGHLRQVLLYIHQKTISALLLLGPHCKKAWICCMLKRKTQTSLSISNAW